MNCHSFESIVADLARERELDATTRDAAAAHAGDCQACGRRLASERALTGGLRAVAAGAAALGAPRRVEAAVLAAFREQTAAAAPNVVPIERGRRFDWRHWSAAAAAAFAVLFGAVAWQARIEPPAKDGPKAAAAPKPVVRPADRIPTTPEPLVAPPGDLGGAAVTTVSTAEPPVRKPRRERPAAAAPQGARDAAPESFEIATDFYPLVAGGNMAPTEGGQIVRVEVPRSSLAAMGFMMNVEHAEERVTADVVLGHDGMARAIRFVQPAMTTERGTK